MTPKLAFMASLGYARMSPEDVCRSLATLGYDGVEWTLSHFNPRTKSERELKDLPRITHEHNLAISEVVLQQDVVSLDDDAREDRIRLVLECIEAAAAVGVSTLNLFTGPAPWDEQAPVVGKNISEGAAWDMVLNAFSRFVAAADAKQVHLAVEGVFGMLCHDYYTTRLLIDEIDSPWLGVNFDPSHDVLAGRLDVGWIARQWAGKDRIKHVHLKDAAGIQQMGKFLFPMLGEGNVNWPDFFQALDDVGYTGFMSVEYESFAYYERVLQGDVEAAARISMEQIGQLLQS